MDNLAPPNVAGAASRHGEQLPQLLSIVGGPAEEPFEHNWLFRAYVQFDTMNIEVAQRLEDRTKEPSSSKRRVEFLGEVHGYRRYKAAAGSLHLVKSATQPYLVAFHREPIPAGFTDEQVFSDLERLVEYAEQS